MRIKLKKSKASIGLSLFFLILALSLLSFVSYSFGLNEQVNGTSLDDGYLFFDENGFNLADTTSIYLYAGHIDGSGMAFDNYRTKIRFNTSSIPMTASISSATLKLYVQSSAGSGNGCKLMLSNISDFETLGVEDWDTDETNINSSWATMNSTLTGTIITQEVSSSIIRGGMTTFSLNSTYELNDSTGASCYTVFNSNNHVTVSTRLFLNITYTLDSCTPPVQPNNWTINLTHSCNITGYANLNLTPGGINYVDNGDVFFNNVNLTVGFFERLSGDAGTSGDIWLFNGSYILRK